MRCSCQGFNPLKPGWSHRAPAIHSPSSLPMSHWASSHANSLSQATCQTLVEWELGVLPHCFYHWNGEDRLLWKEVWTEFIDSCFIISLGCSCSALLSHASQRSMRWVEWLNGSLVLLIDSVSYVTVKHYWWVPVLVYLAERCKGIGCWQRKLQYSMLLSHTYIQHE